MAKKYIYLEMTKEWGGFAVGDVVRFGLTKGLGRIDKGEGVETKKRPAVNDPVPKEKPKVETATAAPKAETAEVTPQKDTKPGPKKVKASKGGEDA
jgi:hypothetical protein